MKDLGQLMKQAQQIQQDMQKAQDELASIEVQGESGGGMVKVTVTCKHEVRRVAIEDSLMDDDREMLEDLIAAACNDANRKVEFLNWLAQETGGHHYSLDDVGNLPEEVSYVESRTSVPQTLELWDMPANFLLLSALLMTEWVMWRRLGGI